MHLKSRSLSFSMPSSCMAVLLFLSLGATNALSAAEYYVSPTGSDDNDGLAPATAWQTVAHVNTRTYSAGDRILFQGGAEFSGAGLVFASGNSGTAENPIIVGSYGTGRATIQPTGNTAGIFIWNTGGITVRDLVFLGPGDRSMNSRAGISAWVDTGNAQSPKFRGLRFENLSVGGFFDGVQMGSSTWNGFADVIFDGCFIHDNVANGMQIWGNYPGTSALQSHANIQILNTEVTRNLGDPALSNPAAQHSGSGIILSGVKGGLIDRCYAHHNGGGSNDNAGGGPVGIWTWNSDSVVIQRSLVHDQRTTPGAKDGGGFDIDGGATNAIIQYCYSYNNEGPGFLIAEFDNAPPLSHGIIRYNISWRDGRRTNMGMASGIHFWKGAGTAATLSNIWVYNNLVYTENATGGPAVTFQSGTMSNLNFWNNIFVVQGGERFVDIPNDAARNYFKFQGNLYWAIDGNYSGGWRWGSTGTTVFTSLADWRAATGSPETLGGQPVGFQLDPRVADIATGAQPTSIAEMEAMTAFRLLADSPAIDAAQNLATPAFGNQSVGTRDFWNTAIPQNGHFDLGPSEFDGPSPAFALTLTAISTFEQVPYSFQLAAANGLMPYTWSLVSGALPPGLSLSSAGLLTGTPTQTGEFPFTVQVSDSATPARTLEQEIILNINVRPLGNATISVNATNILVDRQNQPRPIGINLNNLMDADSKRPGGSRTMAATLTDMNPTFVRWPGGEKADNYLWAVAPTWQPGTHRPANISSWPGNDSTHIQNGVFRPDVQNFDDFMQLQQQAGFEPVIVVAYDSQFHSNTTTRPSREQLLQTAEEWVRYANITKGYNIKYWEIGNESDMTASYNGQTPNMTTYANDVRDYSLRMKAIDPTIKIGLNASSQSNFVTLLEQIHEHVDFLVVHPYPVSGWGSYEHYRTGTRNLVGNATNALNALNAANIPQASKDRITIGSSETNTIDWSGTNPWASSNDTGRGLVAFDLMGQQMRQPKAEYVTFWNTRWVDDAPGSVVYNALLPDNQFRPQGRAVAIWGQFMQERMISASSTLASVIPFATHSPDTGHLIVFLLNKETVGANTTVNLSNYAPAAATARAWQYRGSSPTDINPTWEQLADVAVSGTSLSLTVPSLSITVLEFSPATPLPAQVAFSSATYSTPEGNSGSKLLNLSVRRLGSTLAAASVDFSTSDGTARAGTDYTPTSGTISWAAGETTAKLLSIPILGDTTYELPETFSVTLSNPVGVTLAAPSTATVTLTNDDPVPATLLLVTETLAPGATGQSYGQALYAVGGTAPYAWAVTAGTLPPGLTLHPETGVLSGTPTAAGSFTFTVAVSDATPSLSSQSFTVFIGTPPAAPSALSALAVSSTEISLAWTDNSSDETGFRVEISPDGISDWTLLETVAANTTSATVTSLAPGQTRFFRVAATSAYGNSAWSNSASATTDSGDPNLIAWFKFDEGSGTTVTDSTIIGNNHSTTGIANATWIAAPGGKFAGAYGNTDMLSDVRPINIANQSDLDFDPRGDAFTLSAWVRVAAAAPVGYRTLFDKTTGSTRQFRLWTGNSWGILNVTCGGGQVNFTLPQALNDGQWHLITMTNFNDNGTWRFRVYFNEGDTAAKFAQGNSGTGGKVDANFVIGATSALSNGWKGNIDDVRIYNRALSQAEVGQLYAGTMPGSGSTSAPSAPTTLLASTDPASPQSQILLTWTDTATTESGFKIERSNNGESGWTLIGTTAANLTAFTDPGLPAAATRHYRVLAYNANGDSVPSAAASATTQSASSDDTFAAWAGTIDWNGEDASPLANPDNDPYNNLAEYAMGLDPMADDGVVLQQYTEPDGSGGWNLVMSFPYNPAATDVVWELLRATTIPATPEGWTVAAGEVTVTYPTGRIQFSLPVPGEETEAFLGLRLRLPE